MIDEVRPSYRALLRIPGLPRLVTSMVLARVGGEMLTLTLVLFALDRYGSPAIAGAVTFLAVAPGLIASPIAGALLDRHGRTRLVVLDYAIGACSLFLIATLAAADALPVMLLLGIVMVTSLTGPLSNTGVRTLFPLLVPKPLWERANAIDSNGYVIASIFGPAAAGFIVATQGAPTALVVVGCIYSAAAVAALGLRDPSTRTEERALLGEAWRGLLYVIHNASLRTLAMSVSLANIGWGLFFITLPVLVLQRLGGDAAFVGGLFALLGITGSVAVFVMGRVRTRGREHLFLALAMTGQAAAFSVVLLSNGNPAVVAAAMLLLGLSTGPFDVTLFTVRQRRTDPAWMGRAFAVSMALNFTGFPIGSALGGTVVPISIELAIAISIAACLGGAAISYFFLPREDSSS